MVDNAKLPIGVFDSGLGGLTVVKQIMEILPNENIIYFGDTGRVPYGTRSVDIIRKYATQDMNFLKQKGIKMLIAACGTVSSVASDICSRDENLPYSGVVIPASQEAVRLTRRKKVGVIATTASIKSNSYKNSINSIDSSIEVFQQDCPLLVHLVENGFVAEDDEVPFLVIQRYLKPIIEADVDCLILGCTHFPILAPIISKVMGKNVALIDTGKEAAKWAKNKLSQMNLENKNFEIPTRRFYVSDQTQNFSYIGGLFLGENLTGEVTQVDIDKIEY